jgi:RNA polymerase sigma-70 factor
MTAEEFLVAFRSDIDQLLGQVSRRYSVAEIQVAGAIHAAVKKYNPDALGAGSERKSRSDSGSISNEGRQSVSDLIRSLNCNDLCMAIACANGDETAWEDFYREYRGFMISIARSVTQDATAAEQLADSTFAELYGLRESGGVRVSKFSFYSGRGSLRGWLRAVVFQLSADIYRKTGRFVQTEEAEDLENLAVASATQSGIETDLVGEQYHAAVGSALRRAIDSLEPRERLLLAHYYYDEMTLREIGKLVGVHEATVCRWLAKIQKRTRKLVEKSLARDHHFNRTQVSEALQLAADRLDVNLGDYLVKSAQSEQPDPMAGKQASERAELSLRLD